VIIVTKKIAKTGESHWRTRAAVVLVAALTVAVAGCQVRPLYAPGPTGASVVQILPAIEIAPPTTRPEQIFRNSLLFRLRGGEPEAASTNYIMNYQLRIGETRLAIEHISGTALALQLEGTLSTTVVDQATGRVIVQDRFRATASFDRSTQEFANVRARRDAEERIAHTLADRVAIRLASHFAAQ
jgi:LPS-assembly lipoprotein